MITDAIARRVIDVEDGRDGGTVEKFSYILESKGGKCENIHTFVSDMSPSYINGKEICFPNAQLIIDKFHVKQLMLLAMDEVRREEQGKIASKKKKFWQEIINDTSNTTNRATTRSIIRNIKEISKDR